MVTKRIVNLNSKHRKGTYLYVKEKGVRGAYFKVDTEVPVDTFVQYYTDRYIKGKAEGTLQDYKDGYGSVWKGRKPKRKGATTRQAEQYLKKLKKKPTINQSIKKGISSTEIRNVLTTSQTEIKIAKRKLLRDLVIDDELLEVLILPENMKKFAHRLEYRVEIKGDDGKTLGTTGVFNKTPEEVVNQLRDTVIKGETIDKKLTPKLSKRLSKLGYTDFNHLNAGKVKEAYVRVIFRKGV